MAALSYIPAGTSIRFDVSGNADGLDDADTTIAVRAELAKYFTVQRVSLDASTVFEYSGWPFRADVVVQTTEAYGDVNGPASIVAHAVYEATGYMPSVSAPSYGGPSQPDDSMGGFGDTLRDLASSVGDAIGNVVKGATDPVASEFNKILIVVAVVAVVLIVSAAGKTTKLGVGV